MNFTFKDNERKMSTKGGEGAKEDQAPHEIRTNALWTSRKGAKKRQGRKAKRDE